MIKQTYFWSVLIILSCGIIFFNSQSILFNSDQSLIALRGWTISKYGVDELGRNYPLFFNSQNDYQMPVVSYLSAISTNFFGYTDWGVRIVFVLAYFGLIWITYKISKSLTEDEKISQAAALVSAISPVLIYFASVPSESIILVDLFGLLFITLKRSKFRPVSLLTIIGLILLTSKTGWFILPGFVVATIYFTENKLNNKKRFLVLLGISLILISLFFYWSKIPNGQRSLLENNFSLLNKTSLVDDLNTLRGQSIQSNIPKILTIFFFNKGYLFLIGLFSYINYINPVSLFGNLNLSWLNSGMFLKIFIVPYLYGLYLMFKNSKFKELLAYPLAISIFGFFNINRDLNMLIVSLPFWATIIGLGLKNFNNNLLRAVLFLAAIEVCINIIGQNTYRSKEWIEIFNDNVHINKGQNVLVSDNIGGIPLYVLSWYSIKPSEDSLIKSFNKDISNERLIYKYTQTGFGDFIIINSDKKLSDCNRNNVLILTERDYKKINNFDNEKTYLFNNNQHLILRSDKLCIEE